MEEPLVSIIIPCYNQGHYIKDALSSLSECDETLYDLVIVNDGSTDSFTNEYLQELSENGYKVIFQDNKGLGEARNVGIKYSQGMYVLPLDADNRIYPNYLIKSIEILNKQKDVAVVYGNAKYFGDKNGVLKPGPFNLQRLMLGNYIDACAVIRRSALEEVNYFDNMRIMGYEDWDLWLRIAFKDFKFHYVDEVLFDYRVTRNSMMKTLNNDIKKQNEIEQYFLNKYPDKLSPDFVLNNFIYRIKKRPFKFVYTLILRKFFPGYYDRLIQGNKIYKGFFYDRI